MKKQLNAAVFAIFVFALLTCFCPQMTTAQCMAPLQKAMDNLIRREGVKMQSSAYLYQKSEKEELYSLYSTAVLQLDRQGKKEAVIAYMLENEKNWYKLTARIQNDTLKYTLMQNGKVVGVRKIALFILDVPQPPSCDSINNMIAAQRIIRQAEANACCCRVHDCFPICVNGQIVGWTLVFFDPNRICPKYATDFLLTKKPMLNKQVEDLISQSVGSMQIQ